MPKFYSLIKAIASIEHEVSGATAGDVGMGAEVVYIGGTTVAAGKIYYYDDGGWTLTNASTASSAAARNLLGVALDDGAANSVGMCVRGMITVVDTGGVEDEGDALFLSSSSAGTATSLAPTTSGHTVRVIGYMVTPSTTSGDPDAIFFSPDNTFVEID